jgi:hypothetical protein
VLFITAFYLYIAEKGILKKIFGRKGRVTSERYDKSTELIIYRNQEPDYPIAYGMWQSDIFVLLKGSRITLDENFEEKKPGIKKLKLQLIQNSILVYVEGHDDYTLKQDIFFHSPSAAGELVQGHSSNGWLDWKNAEGVSLEYLQ